MHHERAYLEERLALIKNELVELLSKHGYPTDEAALASDETWARQQEAIRSSESPSGEGVRVARAYAGLLHLRAIRSDLSSISDNGHAICAARAIRHALAVGLLAGDNLTDALQLQWQRRKGALAGGAERHRKTTKDRQEVGNAAARINALCKREGAPLLKPKDLADRLQPKFPQIAPRTLLSYLAPRKPSKKVRRGA